MPTFPFSPFYHNYYNKHYSSYYANNNIQNSYNHNINNKNSIQEETKEKEKEEKYGQEEIGDKKRTSKNNFFANINLSALLDSDINTPIIEILGIKLYLDDLIIIGLLFFLYKEDIQDEILFSILLLLLLS